MHQAMANSVIELIQIWENEGNDPTGPLWSEFKTELIDLWLKQEDALLTSLVADLVLLHKKRGLSKTGSKSGSTTTAQPSPSPTSQPSSSDGEGG